MVKLGMVDPIALLALHFFGGNGHGRAQWHTAMHWQSFVLLLRVLIPTWYVPYKAIFCGDIPLHRPYIGLIYGRYLRFRFLKWPLNLLWFDLVTPMWYTWVIFNVRRIWGWIKSYRVWSLSLHTLLDTCRVDYHLYHHYITISMVLKIIVLNRGIRQWWHVPLHLVLQSQAWNPQNFSLLSLW